MLNVPFADEDLASTAAAAAPHHDDPDYLEMKGIKLTGRPLYLDMQATTPIDPRVIDSMLPYFTDQYGNPHSRTHMYGWESENAVEKSRKQVSKRYSWYTANTLLSNVDCLHWWLSVCMQHHHCNVSKEELHQHDIFSLVKHQQVCIHPFNCFNVHCCLRGCWLRLLLNAMGYGCTEDTPDFPSPLCTEDLAMMSFLPNNDINDDR